MNDGPFTRALESDTQGVIRREIVTYRRIKDVMIRETVTRTYFKDNDYQDSVTYLPLDQ